jgi:hypothetical protein
MHIELNSTDLCCTKGVSTLLLNNLAKLSEPFDRNGDILRAGSVLEAAELVFELVPEPHLGYIQKFVPPTVADRASGSVGREHRAFVNFLGADVLQSDGLGLPCGCPWAFIVSRGIASVSCEIERITKSHYDADKISPGSGEWTVWEGCVSEWDRMHRGKWDRRAIDLESELSRSVSTVVDVRAEYGTVPRHLSAYLDFFAWYVEMKRH